MNTPFSRARAQVLFALAALLAGPALAQTDSASGLPADRLDAAQPEGADFIDEEITVRGGVPLRQFRLEMEAARQEVIDTYNEINSSSDNDIVCRNERPTGTRMRQRVCRSRAQEQADAVAASEFLRSLLGTAGNFRGPAGDPPPPGGPQLNALIGTSTSRNDAGIRAATSRQEIDAELRQLQRENRRLYRAVVKFLDAEQEYLEARREAMQ